MAVEVVELVIQTTQYLLPHLPILVGSYVASNVSAGALQAAGEDAYQYARNLWNNLRGRRPELDAAAELAAQHIDDEDAVGAFRFQLKQLFMQHPEVAEDIRTLLAHRPEIKIVASGDRSVAVGGNLDSSTVITGDGNRIRKNGNEH